MPRTKAKPIEDAPLPGGEALPALSAQHGELVSRQERELKVIDDDYGFDFPYDRDRIVAIAREATVGIGQRYLALGKACILLKEHEGHGKFQKALEEIGIQSDLANRAMNVARKFNLNASRRELVDRLAVMKLFALAHEPDEAIENLIDGGTLAGHTLGEIEKMSVRELRDSLKKERELRKAEAESHEEIVARKDEKINRLHREARGLKRKPANERALALLTQLDAAIAAMLEAGDEAKTLIETISEVYAEAGEDMDEQVETRLRHAAETATSLGEGVERLING